MEWFEFQIVFKKKSYNLYAPTRGGIVFLPPFLRMTRGNVSGGTFTF
jgi:hypothetical protein